MRMARLPGRSMRAKRPSSKESVIGPSRCPYLSRITHISTDIWKLWKRGSTTPHGMKGHHLPLYIFRRTRKSHQPNLRSCSAETSRGVVQMYNMNPDLPYNLNFVGLSLIQFASVTTLMPAYRAVKYGNEDVMSTARKFPKRKTLENRKLRTHSYGEILSILFVVVVLARHTSSLRDGRFSFSYDCYRSSVLMGTLSRTVSAVQFVRDQDGGQCVSQRVLARCPA
jgi:hypothetical protein